MAQYLNDLLTEFLREHRYRNSSEATVETYRTTLSFFLRDSGVILLEHLTPGTVAHWLVAQRERSGKHGKPLSPVTLRHYDRNLRAFCNWLVTSEYLPSSPMAKLKKPKNLQGANIVTFTLPELMKIRDACKRDYAQNKLRDVALVYLLLDTGVRAGEVGTINLHQIAWRERELRVSGKTGGRIVPVSSKTLFKIKRYVTHERWAPPGEPTLFTTKHGKPFDSRNVTQAVRRLTAVAQVESTKRGPHMFRHTFAVEYLRGGGDVFSLKRILGHSSITTTEAYVHYLAEDLAKLHNVVSPVKHIF